MYANQNDAGADRPGRIPPHYAMMYHDDAVPHCPGCGGQHWLVGRVVAECAFCETALPLEHSYRFRVPSGTSLAA